MGHAAVQVSAGAGNHRAPGEQDQSYLGPGNGVRAGGVELSGLLGLSGPEEGVPVMRWDRARG